MYICDLVLIWFLSDCDACDYIRSFQMISSHSLRIHRQDLFLFQIQAVSLRSNRHFFPFLQSGVENNISRACALWPPYTGRTDEASFRFNQSLECILDSKESSQSSQVVVCGFRGKAGLLNALYVIQTVMLKVV